jgi:hypothetical protein
MANGTINSAEYENLPPNAVGPFTLNLGNRAQHILQSSYFTQPPFDITIPNQVEANNELYSVEILNNVGDPLGELYLGGVLQNTFPFIVLRSDIDTAQLVYHSPDIDSVDTDIVSFGISNIGVPNVFTYTGLLTINSAEVVVLYNQVDLDYSAVSAEIACTVTNTVSVWIPVGSTFENTTEIWASSDGTGSVAAGFYSDGTGYRQGNGADFFTVYTACVFSIPLSLSFSSVSGSGLQACANFPGNIFTYYIPAGNNFLTTLTIYTDPLLTIGSIPNDGWYSDGVKWRQMDTQELTITDSCA